MTTEPPAGLRANMATLYNLVSQVSDIIAGFWYDQDDFVLFER